MGFAADDASAALAAYDGDVEAAVEALADARALVDLDGDAGGRASDSDASLSASPMKGRRECGTPGCTQRDFHLGPCDGQAAEPAESRPRRAAADDTNRRIADSIAPQAWRRREYTIERILDQRTVDGATQYLVLWKGYDDETWETEENLADTAALEAWLAAPAPEAEASASAALAPASAPPMPTPEHRVTEAEGLRLHLSDKSVAGYAGVTKNGTGYSAVHTRKYLGTYPSVVDAAVAYARYDQNPEAWRPTPVVRRHCAARAGAGARARVGARAGARLRAAIGGGAFGGRAARGGAEARAAAEAQARAAAEARALAAEVHVQAMAWPRPWVGSALRHAVSGVLPPSSPQHQPPPQQPPMSEVRTVVPQDWKEGQKLEVTAPSGQRVMAAVPAGMGPGSLLRVSFPSATPQQLLKQRILAEAKAEGLRLELSSNNRTGYLGVELTAGGRYTSHSGSGATARTTRRRRRRSHARVLSPRARRRPCSYKRRKSGNVARNFFVGKRSGGGYTRKS